MRTGKYMIAALIAAALICVGTAGANALRATSRTQRLAYVGGSDNSPGVYVATGGHAARRIATGDAPLVSPDGSKVAFDLTGSGPSMAVRAASGAGPQYAFFNAATFEQPIAWSADSRYLAVGVFSNALTTPAQQAGSGLFVIDTRKWTLTKIATGYVLGGGFAPTGDRLVYGLSHSQAPASISNLFTANPDGHNRTQLTHNGRSLYPIWGRKGIVYDREQFRTKEGYPAFQLWLLSGTHQRQLTHMTIPALASGLAPYAISADGNRLLAVYTGQDITWAWRVQLSPLKVSQILVKGQGVQPGSIARDGQRLLVDEVAFGQSAGHGTVEWLPFGGGTAHVLARGGAEPSWNW